MAKNNPYQTTMYGQYPQYGFQQQQQVPTYSGGPIPGLGGFPQTGTPQAPVAPTTPSIPGMLPVEESYIENILRLNRGKVATVYATFENNTEWNARVFKGVVEAAGRDHIILSDPETEMRFLIPMIYLDYVTFDEEIEYYYPFNGGRPPLASFPPRVK